MTRIVVVGGSTGGVRSVQALRRAGFAGELVLLSDESHSPYDRPPLSKEVLGVASDGSPVPLLTSEDVDRLDLDLRLGHRATAVDPERRVLTVVRDAGVPEELGYDVLVIATGVTARRLPGTAGVGGVHVIRTLDDARAVRSRLGPGRNAVVVGAGFIGAEFAAAARARGMEVTLIETQAVPLAHILGEVVGREVSSLHVDNGARLLTGVTVAEIESTDGEVSAVLLDDGTRLPADLVVVGIGASPTTEWLEAAGLPVDNGVECDADMQVVGFGGMYAVGDIARWPHPAYDVPVRIEHWTNAGDQAQVMAAHVMGSARPVAALPYVWSDQYGHRIQIIGRPSEGVVSVVRGAMATSDLLALYDDPEGRLVGALVVDDPRTLMRVRKAMTAGTTTADLEQMLLAATT